MPPFRTHDVGRDRERLSPNRHGLSHIPYLSPVFSFTRRHASGFDDRVDYYPWAAAPIPSYYFSHRSSLHAAAYHPYLNTWDQPRCSVSHDHTRQYAARRESASDIDQITNYRDRFEGDTIERQRVTDLRSRLAPLPQPQPQPTTVHTAPLRYAGPVTSSHSSLDPLPTALPPAAASSRRRRPNRTSEERREQQRRSTERKLLDLEEEYEAVRAELLTRRSRLTTSACDTGFTNLPRQSHPLPPKPQRRRD